MTFECKHCGKRWEEEGYTKEGTFYTLCKECGDKMLYEGKMEGKRKKRQKKRKENKRQIDVLGMGFEI